MENIIENVEDEEIEEEVNDSYCLVKPDSKF